MRIAIHLLILFFGLSQISCALTSITKRKDNRKQEEGLYVFSTLLTWSYTNELAKEVALRSGVIRIYVDEKSGAFLFTKIAYGWSGEMIDYIIADQSGNYLIASTDEHGGKHRVTNTIDKYQDVVQQSKKISKEFKKYYHPTSKKKNFGEEVKNGTIISGNEYMMIYQNSKDTNIKYVALSAFSYLPLYLFNNAPCEAKLPVAFESNLVLPDKYMILEDVYDFGGRKSTLSFVSATPVEYSVDINIYKIQK